MAPGDLKAACSQLFIDKANLFVALLKTGIGSSLDIRWLESKLEDTGHSQLHKSLELSVLSISDGQKIWL